jgi:hypothetical protein
LISDSSKACLSPVLGGLVTTTCPCMPQVLLLMIMLLLMLLLCSSFIVINGTAAAKGFIILRIISTFYFIN